MAKAKAFPDALPGTVTEMAVCDTNGCENATSDGALEEPPQRAGGQAEPSDSVDDPDADCPSAAAPSLAVTAKDPPGADRFALRRTLVVAAQITVANQGADKLAVGTGRLFEPLRQRDPFLGIAAKPARFAHWENASDENRDFTDVGKRRGRGEVR